MTYLLLLFLASFASELKAQSHADLYIEVSGPTSMNGQVRIAVFNSGESWLDTPIFAEVIEIENGLTVWRIENVPYGEYAIAAFHDKNENGENDASMLGIPKEPYGFSNDARARFGPPKWDRARFAVIRSMERVKIHMK